MAKESAIGKYLNYIQATKEALNPPDLSLEAMCDVISRQLTQSQANHFIDYLIKNYEAKYGCEIRKPYSSVQGVNTIRE